MRGGNDDTDADVTTVAKRRLVSIRGGQGVARPTRAHGRRRGGWRSAKLDNAQRYARFRDEYLAVEYIDTKAGLTRMLRELRELAPASVAVDYEVAMESFRRQLDGAIRTIQIGVDDPDRGIAPRQWIVDCFRVDPAPVAKLLSDRKIEKQIHFADFEQQWTLARFGVGVENVYDTCRAWQVIQDHLGKLSPEELAETGVPWQEKHPNKLSELVERYIGLELPKEEQVSDWSRAELRSEQVVYAALDVAILPPLSAYTKQVVSRLGLDDAVSAKIANADMKLRARIQRFLERQRDHYQRVRRAMERCSSLDELEQIRTTAAQATLKPSSRKQLGELYQERKAQLQAETLLAA